MSKNAELKETSFTWLKLVLPKVVYKGTLFVDGCYVVSFRTLFFSKTPVTLVYSKWFLLQAGLFWKKKLVVNLF